MSTTAGGDENVQRDGHPMLPGQRRHERRQSIFTMLSDRTNADRWGNVGSPRGIARKREHPMIAPAGSHSPTERREADARDPEPREAERRANSTAAFLRQGAFAGLLGAVLLAAWFLYIDVILRGEPLFTPTVLASALLGRGVPAAPQPSLALALLYTLVHGLVFVGIGVGTAYVLHRFEIIRHRALLIVLVFTVLCLGFFAFAANVSALGPETIAIRDALIGNAIAAFAIGAYLARLLPREDEL